MHVLRRRCVNNLLFRKRAKIRSDEEEKTWEQINDLLTGNKHAVFWIRVSRYFFLYNIYFQQEAFRVGRINYTAKYILSETPGQLQRR